MRILVSENSGVIAVQEVSYAKWNDDREGLDCFCPDNDEWLCIDCDYDTAISAIKEMFENGLVDLTGCNFEYGIR